MNDDAGLEAESAHARNARRRAKLAYWTASVVACGLFVASIVWLGGRHEGNAPIGLALLPGALLTLWWLILAVMIARLDELDRAIEIRSVAAGGVGALWLLTSWSALHELAGVAMIPLIFFAPIAALLYGAARLAWALFYS